MFCTVCGAQAPDNAVSCAVCGSPLGHAYAGGQLFASSPPSNGALTGGVPLQGGVSPVRQERQLGVLKIAALAVAAAVTAAAITVGVCLALGLVDAPWHQGDVPLPGGVDGRGVDGQAAADPLDEGASSEEAPLEYAYETVVIERYDADSGPNSNKVRFSYVQITCSQPNATVDQLNAQMKEEAEDAFAKKLTDEIYSNPTSEQKQQVYYPYFNYGISYFEGGTACIMRMCSALSPGAAHGQAYNQCLIVNLDTGEETTAARFAGVTDEDLRAMAWKAVDAYLPTANEMWGSAGEAFSGASPSGLVPEGAAIYYLSPDGVVALFEQYMLGSYMMGTPGLLVCDYGGNAIARASDYPLQVEESGQMTGMTESEIRAEAERRQAEEEAARQAAERAREEEEARFAERKAQYELTALAFATQYFTNGAFSDPNDDTRIQPVGNDTWRGLVLQYLEPGSAAVETFQAEFSGPIGGLGGFCYVTDSHVVESSADRVVVEVRYLATQNPSPGWSRSDAHASSAQFACTFADSGLVDSYEVS